MACKDRTKKLWERLSKQKIIESHDTKTVLNRYLTTGHLTFMGVGATVGVGIYVLIGVAAKEIAGPGLLLSFVLAGLVTMLNAVMFAEFGSRIPTTGACYTYIYQSMCEGLAYIVGWLMLIGYFTSGAIGCRAWSGYFDSLFNGAIHNYTSETVGSIGIGPPFSDHFDFLASLLELVAILVVAVGIHASAIINITLSMVSVSVLIFVTFMGFIVGDLENVSNADNGGFLPFGFRGVLVATSSCLYAYQGFDIICMSAEESKTPNKSIPRAIFLELTIVTLLYAGTSLALIMLTPCDLIDIRAPLPSAFENRGLIWAKYIVTIGPVLGIANLNLLNLYSSSRHMYCLANDGLLLKFCGVVNERTRVPIISVVIAGLIVSVSTLVLDLSELVQFNVLSLFIINIILSLGVIILRYGENSNTDSSEQKSNQEKGRCFLQQIRIEYILIVLVVLAVVLGSLLVWTPIFVTDPNIPAVVVSVIVILCIIGLTYIIKSKLKPSTFKGFKVPLVPFLPVLNAVTNIILLLYTTDIQGLISFMVLVVIGYIFYFILILTTRAPTLTRGDYSKLQEDAMDMLVVEEESDN